MFQTEVEVRSIDEGHVQPVRFHSVETIGHLPVGTPESICW